MDTLTSVAIASRDVRFSVTHDKRSVLALAPAVDMRSRIAGIWGARYAERLVEVEEVQGAVHVMPNVLAGTAPERP
jgi:DNA mismatch repair ATPase MutL